jgi:hypothetical protein
MNRHIETYRAEFAVTLAPIKVSGQGYSPADMPLVTAAYETLYAGVHAEVVAAGVDTSLQNAFSCCLAYPSIAINLPVSEYTTEACNHPWRPQNLLFHTTYQVQHSDYTTLETMT